MNCEAHFNPLPHARASAGLAYIFMMRRVVVDASCVWGADLRYSSGYMIVHAQLDKTMLQATLNAHSSGKQTRFCCAPRSVIWVWGVG